MYDLGSEGLSLTRVTQMGFDLIARYTLSALRTTDKTLASSLVTLSVLPKSESSTLHLLAITAAGVCVCVCGWVWVYIHCACKRQLSVT